MAKCQGPRWLYAYLLREDNSTILTSWRKRIMAMELEGTFHKTLLDESFPDEALIVGTNTTFVEF